MTRARALGGRRRLWVPEVIQTSSTDCGPACLLSFLAGFGVEASYGRLRDVCYTDVDGTSIDDLEDVARRLGLDANQTMVPVEHLLHGDAGTLPAIVVLALPAGVTHFVVVWRTLGAWVQVMDPAGGRRWLHRRHLLEMLHVHRTEIPADAWHAWARTRAFVGPLSTRMLRAGLPRSATVALLGEALEDESWQSLATLDAATRLVESIARERGAAAGQEAAGLLASLAGRVPLREQAAWLPERCWSARALPAAPGESEPTMLRFEGAVLVTASGRTPTEPDAVPTSPGAPSARACEAPASACEAPTPGVLATLLSYLRADGRLAPMAMASAALLAGLATVFEALLLKGLMELGLWIHAPSQRAAVVLAVAMFATLALLVELRLATGVRTLGRRMEARLRLDFLRKLARLPDAYFSRRLTSDLTLRIHSVVQVRGVPAVGESILRSLCSLVLVTAGIVWVDPGCAPWALAAAVVALALPLLFQARQAELQLAVATYQGGLSRYFLDALLGALPLRAHVGRDGFRDGHGHVLARWARARRGLIRTSMLVETLISATGMLMSGIILHVHLARASDTSSVLLLLFWSQQLPALGRTFARSMLEYPARRAAAARLLEPIHTPDEPQAPVHAAQIAHDALASEGVAVAFREVRLELGRARILDGLALELPPGCHCAVVGPSGAGKSSLAGLLLGLYGPSHGHIEIDGRRLGPAELPALREATAWVDPQVQLWNRSLLQNLSHGAGAPGGDVVELVEAAELRPTLEKLPAGLGSSIGEGGGMLSEGEGQRVRLARALGKRNARLVLLDEPFRGLDRASRARCFSQLRRWWPHATVLCVTHDVSETLGFDKVVVLEEGRIAEQGHPDELVRRPGSVYRDMLDAERRVRAALDDDSAWSRWVMQDGCLDTGPAPTSDRAPRPVAAAPSAVQAGLG